MIMDTKSFYETLKYPGPEALISYIWATRLRKHIPRDKAFTFLDAGCGTGQHTAGMLETYPNSRAYCIDISQGSLNLARTLLERRGLLERVTLICKSYMTPINIPEPVDVALAIGTVHHCPDPLTALRNIAAVVKPHGLICLMVYGIRGHRQRYEIKEAIQILSYSYPQHVEKLYTDWARRYNTAWHRPMHHVYREWRGRLSKHIRRLMGKKTYGYFDPKLSGLFIQDAMLNPIDVAFDTEGVRRLIEGAGLSILDIIGLAKDGASKVPPMWRSAFLSVPFWDQVRVAELIDPDPKSWSFILEKP